MKLLQIQQYIQTQLKPINVISGSNLLMIDYLLSVINAEYFKKYERVLPINIIYTRNKLTRNQTRRTESLHNLLEATTPVKNIMLLQSAIVLSEREETVVIKDIETLVHRSVLIKVLHYLFKAFSENKSQLILVTQSLETISASVSNINPDNSATYRYHDLSDVEFNPKAYDSAEISQWLTRLD